MSCTISVLSLTLLLNGFLIFYGSDQIFVFAYGFTVVDQCVLICLIEIQDEDLIGTVQNHVFSKSKATTLRLAGDGGTEVDAVYDEATGVTYALVIELNQIQICIKVQYTLE
ncbi:MAG: hypothetical protein EZS28_012531 [Streblomastix strix]|uniref:Uncharacterized protein n=1 Tax=Streblomastix strix TaxID=222440 RepID=A0A5J4WBB1_9EUKA|nr:MAG: hypothetical protein EZS28_012531 [Streblomastix strix]